MKSIKSSSCRRYPDYTLKNLTWYYGSMRLLVVIVVLLVSEMMKIEVFVKFYKITLRGEYPAHTIITFHFDRNTNNQNPHFLKTEYIKDALLIAKALSLIRAL